MDEKHGTKLHHLDLAKRRHELEGIFDSVINRISDLSMPRWIRLSGEEDYFNRTKSIKLIPFRKQQAFERCTSPDLIKQSESSGGGCASRDGLARKKEKTRPTNLDRLPKSVLERDNQPKRVHRVSFKSSTHNEGRVQAELSNHSVTLPEPYKKVIRSPVSVKTSPQLELIKKREVRDRLNKKYSKMIIKNKHDGNDQRLGFDKLFREIPSTNYPFANPMPECMLTDDNIDNLREIIVSAVNIEWKMLTPVRPTSEYEEKYFDKLIQLYRNRYRSRLEAGYFASNQTTPFKHTRHTYLLHYGVHQRCRSPLSSVAKLKKSFATRREHLRSISTRPNIPTLTLTSDETKSSELIESICDDSEKDYQEFNYENFSRFSRKNVRFSMEGRASGRQGGGKQRVGKSNARNNNASNRYKQEHNNQRQSDDRIDFLQNDEILEGRVGEIMSSLMSTQI